MGPVFSRRERTGFRHPHLHRLRFVRSKSHIVRKEPDVLAGELLARVRAQLRRHQQTPAGETTIRFGDVDIEIPFKVAKQQLVDEFDRRYLQALLEAHDNNISAAARAAGIERMSIYKMIRRLGLDEDSNNDKRREGEEEDADDE